MLQRCLLAGGCLAVLSATAVGAAELEADVVKKTDGYFRCILMDWGVKSLDRLMVTVRDGFAGDELYEQFVSLQLYGYTVPSADDFHFRFMEQGEEYSLSSTVDGKVEVVMPESWRLVKDALVAVGLQVGPAPRLVSRQVTNWSREATFVTEMPARDGSASQFFYFTDAWVSSIAHIEAQLTASFLQAKEQAALELEEEDDLLGCFMGQQVPELPYGVAEVEQLRLFVGSGVNVTGARVQFWRRVKFGEGQLRHYFLVGEFYLEALFGGMERSSPVYVKPGDEIAWLVPNATLEGHWDFGADGDGQELAQCLFGMVQSCNENEFCAFQDTRVTKHTHIIVEVAPIYNLHSERALKAHRRQRDVSFLSMALEREASEAEDFYAILVQHKRLLRWRSLTVFVKDLDPEDLELTAKYWHRVQQICEVFVAVSVLRTAGGDIFAKLRAAVEFLKLVATSGPLVVMVAAGQAGPLHVSDL